MPYAKILAKQATYTLEKLHAELAGKILDHKKEGRRLVAAMKHVEAVLKLLQPGYDVRPIAVRRKKLNPWFKRGTVLRHVLGALRKADSPLTAREITERMVMAHGVSNPDAAAIRALTTTVSSCLQAAYGDSGEGSQSGRDAVEEPCGVPDCDNRQLVDGTFFMIGVGVIVAILCSGWNPSDDPRHNQKKREPKE
jgi:hypothetical protein